MEKGMRENGSCEFGISQIKNVTGIKGSSCFVLPASYFVLLTSSLLTYLCSLTIQL